MTVRELILQLQTYEQDAPVWVDVDGVFLPQVITATKMFKYDDRTTDVVIFAATE